MKINTKAATAFLDWITSPAVQTKIGQFLSEETAGDPPFLPSAAPNLKITTKAPSKVVGSKKITVTGSIANETPPARRRSLTRPFA